MSFQPQGHYRPFLFNACVREESRNFSVVTRGQEMSKAEALLSEDSDHRAIPKMMPAGSGGDLDLTTFGKTCPLVSKVNRSGHLIILC